MWFRFPKNVSQISVQQQLFVPEVRDDEGYDLFRAPDHFAAIILDQPGFAVPEIIPPGAPEDLPKILGPEVSNEVAALAAQLRQKDFEIDNLRASLTETSMERDTLRVELSEVKTELANHLAEGEENEESEEKGKKKSEPTHEGVRDASDKKTPPTEPEPRSSAGFHSTAPSRDKR